MAQRKRMKTARKKKAPIQRFAMHPQLTDAGQTKRSQGQGRGYEEYELMYNRSYRVAKTQTQYDIARKQYQWL